MYAALFSILMRALLGFPLFYRKSLATFLHYPNHLMMTFRQSKYVLEYFLGCCLVYPLTLQVDAFRRTLQLFGEFLLVDQG